MAKHETITFDKTEISIYDVSGKRPAIYNLTYERITSIQLDHSEIKKFYFFKKPSDRIMVQIRGMENPLNIYAVNEPKFDEYCDGLRKFCKENRITLRDYLSNPAK